MGLDSPSRCIVDSGGKCEEKQLLSAVFRYENAHRYLHWMHLRVSQCVVLLKIAIFMGQDVARPHMCATVKRRV